MRLLDELRRDADAHRDASLINGLRPDCYPARVELAMRHGHSYLLDAFKQLDVIRPDSLQRFHIPNVGMVDGLRLAETFIDYCVRPIGAREYIHRLQALVTWAAPSPLSVHLESPEAVCRARIALEQRDIRHELSDAGAPINGTRLLVIPRRVVTDISIYADHDNGTLEVRARNLFGFSDDAFSMPADPLSDLSFERLVHAILGRRSAQEALRPSLRLVG